jgi:Amidohydrolase
VQEWCAAAPGRFIPMCLIPMWDMDETLKELKRMSELGVHAVSFSDNPANIGLPSIHNPYWEPFWKACCEYKMVINCHIGTGARALHPSSESPIDAWITAMPISIANSAADWTFATFWKRYPDLRMALSEGGIGWIPYFLERADFTYEHHREWTFSDFAGERPSDLFKRHVICCFIDDQFGVKNLEYMNEDMVCYRSTCGPRLTGLPRLRSTRLRIRTSCVNTASTPSRSTAGARTAPSATCASWAKTSM